MKAGSATISEAPDTVSQDIIRPLGSIVAHAKCVFKYGCPFKIPVLLHVPANFLLPLIRAN
jgi:hypothetical protein